MLIRHWLRHNDELYNIVLEEVIEWKRRRERSRINYVSQIITGAKVVRTNKSKIKRTKRNPFIINRSVDWQLKQAAVMMFYVFLNILMYLIFYKSTLTESSTSVKSIFNLKKEAVLKEKKRDKLNFQQKS